MKSTLTWFEVPVTDLERAAAFYEAVFAVELWRQSVAGIPHAIFPVAEGGVTGALVTRAPTKPGPFGTTAYLACDNVDSALERALAAGGKQAMPKTPLPNIGDIAAFRDLDGNIIGLHTR
jgi:predicted enzyme related to lactoylglutathione lyase